MRLKNFLGSAASLLLLFCASQPAGADPGYFIKFYDPASFLPLMVGGNGKFLVGTASGGADLVIWTKQNGLKMLAKAPPGYILNPKAVDTEGNAVTGIIQTFHGTSENDEGAMFWWSATTGLHLLTAIGRGSDNVWDMDISDDGRTVEFFCPNQSSIPSCPGSATALANWPATARLWTLARGFEYLGKDIRYHFEFAKTSGDFRSIIFGKLSPSESAEHQGTKSYLFLDESGERYVTFKDLPPHVYSYEEQPATYSLNTVLTNRTMSIFALSDISSSNQTDLPLPIWNKYGNPVKIQNLPNGCTKFTPYAVTDLGAFFGTASCPDSQTVAFRINATSAESIGDWLDDHDVRNDLNLSTAINSISNDGKTILGLANLGSVDISSSDLKDIHRKHNDKPMAGETNVGTYVFVAHIP